jgi:hypothetical protein
MLYRLQYSQKSLFLLQGADSSMAENLIRIFQKDVLEGDTDGLDFLQGLGPVPEEDLSEFFRWLIRNVEYDDNPSVVKKAYHYLASHRDISSLKPLESLKGVWQNTYLHEYEYLLALLRNAARGAKCNCAVYADTTFNVAPYQDDLEIVRQDRRDYDGFVAVDVIYVKCGICGSEWEVEVDYCYHYPHSHWRLNR